MKKTTPRFRVTLAVGATGMLAEALLYAAGISDTIAVVSRNARRFVSRRRISNAIPFDLDYRHSSRFLEVIEREVDLRQVDLVLLWVHESGSESLCRLFDIFRQKDVLVVHVLGSASGDPRATSEMLTHSEDVPTTCRYRTVVLGSKTEFSGWRWLTNHEISAGTIAAIDNDQDTVVGTIRGW